MCPELVSSHVDSPTSQAYLSRALRDRLGLHVLALDWSTIQSDGAIRREKNKKKMSTDVRGIDDRNKRYPEHMENPSIDSAYVV